MLASGNEPPAVPEYDQFVAALSETIADTVREGKTVTFIAGVDMAHVGRHFDDSQKLSPEFMQEIRRRDTTYLNAVAARDKSALFTHIAEDSDQRKVCGFPTLYTVLDTTERLGWKLQASLFDYQQAVDYQTDCAVTFAALGLFHAKTA